MGPLIFSHLPPPSTPPLSLSSSPSLSLILFLDLFGALIFNCFEGLPAVEIAGTHLSTSAPPAHVPPTCPRPLHTSHLITSQPPVRFLCKSYASIHVPSPIHIPATSTCPHTVQGPPTRLRPTHKSQSHLPVRGPPILLCPTHTFSPMQQFTSHPTTHSGPSHPFTFYLPVLLLVPPNILRS